MNPPARQVIERYVAIDAHKRDVVIGVGGSVNYLFFRTTGR
jgi:hypothetical protein